MDKINVLLITGVVTSEHDYREMNRNIVSMLESTGRFSVKVTEDFDGSTPKTLEKYQMVLLNYDGMTSIADDDSIYWSEESLNALVDFVKSGGGDCLLPFVDFTPSRHTGCSGRYHGCISAF